MVEKLATLIFNFKGPRSRVRCFAHIINLVVKIILRQFDIRVKSKKRGEGDEVEQALAELSEELDAAVNDAERGDEDGDEEDDVAGVEELEEAMETDIELIRQQLKPIRQVLTKI